MSQFKTGCTSLSRSGPCMLTWRRALERLMLELVNFVDFLFISPSLLHSQTTKAVYNRIIDLKIATPQIVINFGSFLEEHHYFEEAFKVISSIHFPLHGCKFYKIYIFSLNRPTREALLCSSGLTLMNYGTPTSPNS